ncbi:MAG: type V CRISPR-associated protein Cas12b [Lentisphaerae bacterium]|nr:type V CRISPR-associated protein Cas12b [Lentisphaerota bacterium]
MNRIYQGKVTAVEILDGKEPKPFDSDPKKAKEKWQAALWQHHQLFQDAVNYYTLALAAMAVGCADGVFRNSWLKAAIDRALADPKLKENARVKVAEDAKAAASAKLNALLGWAAKVRETWVSASRRAEMFNGPQARLAPILKLDPDESGFEKAADCVLRSSRATAVQRSVALLQLLEEADKGDLNKVCGERIAFLCPANPRQKKRPTSKAVSSVQEQKRQQEVRRFHQMPEAEARKAADSLNLGLFLTQPPTECLEGPDAVKELRKKFSKAAAKFPELKTVSAEFEKHLTAHSATLRVPPPGRKPSGLYPLAAVFKFFPCEESLRAFLQATKTLADAKEKAVVGDDIADARMDDKPHFDFFTNLAFVSGEDGDRDTRAVWFEFDLAAFVEAIKAPHRYFQDTIKREAAADRLRQQVAAMEGKGHESSGADEEGESLPGFEGDTRIELLKSIVQKKLAWLAEAEGEVTASGPKEYAIRERTVRGFGEIKRRWRAACEAGKATEKRLREILAKEQTEHRDDFGSATLYRELAKPDFYPIWRDGGTQPWHAEDPLAAWLDYKDLLFELHDKERPIRFTPAHPKCSPRFFIFPKKSEAQSKTPNQKPPKPGLLSRHEPGQLSFTAGVILRTERGFTPTVARIHYAAPRICRDKLRSAGDINLYEAPWLQPMMAALGLDKSPDRVNFANCRITLQPGSESDIQLAFPIEVSTEKIEQWFGYRTKWDYRISGKNKQMNFAQFNYSASEPRSETSLRWPSDIQFAKEAETPRKSEPVPWHEKLKDFCCVATDLGQRDAGAFARLLIRSDSDFGRRPSRAVGATGGKQWRAALERSGLFRLPGEDAQVWREKSRLDESDPDDSGKPFDFREELWGERGRPARDWEADDTAELMRLLEAVDKDAEGKERLTLLSDDWHAALSFPEQNDKLLVAMRRYQSRAARLHRWCWFLKGDDKQQDAAREEICDCDDTRLVTPELKTLVQKRDPRAMRELELQLRQSLKLSPDLLVRIANRVLPLRGRSWCWEKHPATIEKNILHHLTQKGPSLDSKEKPIWLRGQRGLSMERIEQIEELRKRFQSLNQTLRREIGGKPPIRRDESVPDPCPDLLDKLENLKEQRVNQTAHMILAEALGLRLAPPPADKNALRQQQDQHGVYEKITDKQGRLIGPADFIVIEDLSRYRASQGRAPSENSRLMKWCHRAVRDKLKQLCEVFGLPVLETPAAYSSRFCSRSGVPGFRAAEVTAGFTKKGQWAWLAGKKDEQGNPKEEARRLSDLDRDLTEAQEQLQRDWKRSGPCPKRTLLVPISGGPVFVPVVDKVEGAEIDPAIVQADINAAINLALRAIADPRLWTIHPRLRSLREGGDMPARGKKTKAKQDTATPKPEARLLTREKRKYGEAGKLLVIHSPSIAKSDDTRQPNFFADFAGLEAIADKLVKQSCEFAWLKKEWTYAEISDESSVLPLLHGKSFWGCVKAWQWERIQTLNQRRLQAWRDKADNLKM